MAGARLERAGEGLAHLALAFQIASAQLWVADREAPVLALEQRGVAILAQPACERPAALHRHVLLRWRRLEQGDQLPQRGVDALVDQREQQLVLAREVPVQRALRVAGLGGDIVDARVAVAPLREHPQSRCEELVASLALVRTGCARAVIGAPGVTLRGGV